MDMLSYFLGRLANGESGGGNDPILMTQADYEQNDASAADYIKNRPFYEIPGEKIEKATFIPGEQDDISQPVSVNGKLNISPEKEYLVTITIEGTEITEAAYCFIDPESGLNVLCFSEEYDSETVFLNDGIFADFSNPDEPIIQMGDYYTYDARFFPAEAVLFEIGGGEIKKIDKKFLPEDIATKLEVATPDILGGVQPVAKNDSMTQEVGIDENGRLYTKPGSQEYTLPVASIGSLGGIYTTQTYNGNIHTLNTAMANGKLYVEKPSIAGTVTEDPSIAPSCAAVYTFIENCFKEATY